MKKGYKRLINWIEENVDLETADSYDDGYRKIYDELQDPETDKGAYKALEQETVKSNLEDMMFGGVISDRFKEREPNRPELVKDEEKWRKRGARLVKRSKNTGRMSGILDRLREGVERKEVLKELAERFDRSISTIEKDLRAMRNVGWLERTKEGLWRTSEEGKEALEGWR